jgi:hypothetical protein
VQELSVAGAQLKWQAMMHCNTMEPNIKCGTQLSASFCFLVWFFLIARRSKATSYSLWLLNCPGFAYSPASCIKYQQARIADNGVSKFLTRYFDEARIVASVSSQIARDSTPLSAIEYFAT